MTFLIDSKKKYQSEYLRSITNPRQFWSEIADNFFWFKKWDEVLNYDFNKPDIEWFKGASTNISYNCLDRHLLEENCDKAMKDKVAIIFEPNDPEEKSQKITYQELFEKTCQFANLLVAQGIKKGDRVCIYMPMIPEAAIAMLACARIGAVHSVVFAGFSAKSLANRLQDSQSKMLITADLLYRGDKTIKLFEIAQEALLECDFVEKIILCQREKSSNKKYESNKIKIWQDEIKKYPKNHQCQMLDANDPFFILYTSGSTGKPKGIMHAIGGYMVYVAYSFKNIFQYRNHDIFFCSADIGWITGHSYLIYGPLLNGATSLMFEGVPTYPDASRFWQIIEKHQVNIFYTAPTAIRALMQKGDEFVARNNLSSLKVLGSVGEPINQEAWQWYYEKVGRKKCPIVDTWWQTETGGILISALAGITESKASYAGRPYVGIKPILLDDDGREIIEKNKTGNLCFALPWPSMARGIWGDEQKFFDTYFSPFKGYYFSGDGAFIDKNGLYRIIGRVDDVLNVSGHRLGTAEIENVVNKHQDIAESAVIGFAHKIKGEAICVFAISKTKIYDENKLKNEIINLINDEIGPIAKPDKIYIVSDLPKTRSGKIMRRILKKIIAQEKDLGDISTLVNPEIIQNLILLF